MSMIARAFHLAHYLALPHADGCEAPGRASGGAAPADLYTRVADGKGGDMMKCLLCGASEASAPKPTAGAPALWTEPEWLAIVKAYRACGEARPSQIHVAQVMGFDTEQPLRDRLRGLGIRHWRAVHPLIAAESGA